MKGKIRKYIDSDYDGKTRYRIEYLRGDLRMPYWLDIEEEDMPEFMDDIYSQHLKEKGKESNKPVRETALELIERAKDKCLKEIGRVVVKVITKQEEAEQDKDEREREKLLIEKYKTYNNPFPTDEALDFDVNIRERV